MTELEGKGKMNLDRMTVSETHRVHNRSCYDFRANALIVSTPTSKRRAKLFARTILWLGGLLIQTGLALQRSACSDHIIAESPR